MTAVSSSRLLPRPGAHLNSPYYLKGRSQLQNKSFQKFPMNSFHNWRGYFNITLNQFKSSKDVVSTHD